MDRQLFCKIKVVKTGKWDFKELDKLVSEGWRVERMEVVKMAEEMIYYLKKVEKEEEEVNIGGVSVQGQEYDMGEFDKEG